MRKIIVTPETPVDKQLIKLICKVVMLKYDEIQPYDKLLETKTFKKVGLCYLYQKTIFNLIEFRRFGYCDNWSPSVIFFREHIYPLMLPDKPEGVEENEHWWKFDAAGSEYRHVLIFRVLYRNQFPNGRVLPELKIKYPLPSLDD